MDELFLHYLWEYQKFNFSSLATTNNIPITVYEVGYHNDNSGPDFEEARLKIGEVEWAGSIEIHHKSSDWVRHAHQENPAYNNVILHVVWEHDKTIKIENEVIPTLSLKDITDPNLITTYQQFLRSQNLLLCKEHFYKINPITYHNMLDRVAIDRLRQKAERIKELLGQHKNNWEEVAFHTLAQNFGFSINKEPFQKLANSLSHKVLTKYAQTTSLEALLFGQAGFLDLLSEDDYQHSLKNEFDFLKQKHQLTQPLERHHWKFSKLRPANFPVVRIAQLAGIIRSNPHLFTYLIEIHNPKELIDHFKIAIGDYWKEHYDFGKTRSKPISGIGKETLNNLIINTIAPLLAAYSSYIEDQEFMDKAVLLLELTTAENNKIVRVWQEVNKKPKNAFESQGLIEWYNNLCVKKSCLRCGIGSEIVFK